MIIPPFHGYFSVNPYVPSLFDDLLSFVRQDPINENRDIIIVVVCPIDCIKLGNNRVASVANILGTGKDAIQRQHLYSIIFNNACISKLDQVVYVQVLVNPAAEKLVIRPCEEGARDAIRWCIAKDDKRKSRQITCGLFTAKLYEMMGWEALYRYKLQGTRINYQGEQLYVFDLTSTEIYLPQAADSAQPGKRKRSIPVYPADWRESFGIPVQDHTRSTEVDLMDGYSFMDLKKQDEPIQVPMEMVDQETGEVTKV